jgi:tRNA pseudouridine55 synthase
LINGFVVIDKPPGITSHDVVSRVRRILGTRKVGHTGTLDPFATGVLPVAVNDGTKSIPFLDEGLKCYEALMQLGVATDTLDMTGFITQQSDWSSINSDSLVSVFKQFTGRLSQIPPMYSAIKCGGQPLYKLARQGQVIERKAREIEISSLDIISFDPPFVGFKVVCSRGTYVRTLADDIGTTLGCRAALKELRRLASGPFLISNAVTLDELETKATSGDLSSCSIAPAKALGNLIGIPLREEGLQRVRHGRSPVWSETTIGIVPHLDDGDMVRLMWDGELAAVAQYSLCDGAEPRIILKRVFM